VTGTGPDGFPAENGDGFGRDDRARHENAGPEDVAPGFGADGDEDLADPLEDDPDDYRDIAAGFRPIPGGAACFFEPAQAGVIRSLVAQVAELVRDDSMEDGPANQGTPPDELEMLLGLSANDEVPDDPVLARLLPDAYKDDPRASAEFRRYTEESLRSGKVNSAQAVLASLPSEGGEVVLSEPECQQWLRALNDVRLALGIRLGITDENEDLTEDLSLDEPRAAYVWVYQWLAYLQDSLIESLA
jgi:uncharacterized protein DUF2017